MADFALYTGARLAELRRLRWSDMNLVDRFVTLRSPWATFLKAHWGAIAAMDFFKVEVMTLTGPVRYSVLVVMDLETREVRHRVEIDDFTVSCGSTSNRTE
jgi:integrase